MHVEKALGVVDRAGEIVDQDRRCGRGDDGVGRDAFRGRRQHLALELDHFRHAFEHHAGAGQRRCHILRRHHRNPGDDGFGVIAIKQSEPRQAGQGFSDFTERIGLEYCKTVRGARLDIDHGDVVAGIGERHRDAAAHAAGAETGDDGASSGHR